MNNLKEVWSEAYNKTNEQLEQEANERRWEIYKTNPVQVEGRTIYENPINPTLHYPKWQMDGMTILFWGICVFCLTIPITSHLLVSIPSADVVRTK